MLAQVGGRPLHLPGDAIHAAIEQHGTSVAPHAGTQQHVPHALLLPHLGVAHVAAAVGGVAVIPQHQALGPKTLPIADDDDLVGKATCPIVVVVALKQLVAGVIAPHHAVGRYGRAGVGAILVQVAAGHDGGAQPLPGAEVARGPVPPAMCRVGPEPAVLVEEVVGAVQLAEAVGIGDVTRLGLEVEPQAPIVLGVCDAVDCHGISSGMSWNRRDARWRPAL